MPDPFNILSCEHSPPLLGQSSREIIHKQRYSFSHLMIEEKERLRKYPARGSEIKSGRLGQLSAQMTWPPKLSKEQEKELLFVATDYALSNSIVYRPPATDQAPSTNDVIHAPYSLYPTPISRILFDKAYKLQRIYNELYMAVTMDEQWLDEVVDTVKEVDDFQGKLYELWKIVRSEGIKQPLQLGLFRSDYLSSVTDNEIGIKQVEFNTISSSFGSLASRVSGLHRYLQTSGFYPNVPELNIDAIPINHALEGLAGGLATAHRAYGNSESKVLMLVQDNERNAYDQLLIQYTLLNTHNIQLLRIPFSQLQAKLSQDSKLIIVDPHTTREVEVSVVYYRCLYTPTDYTSSASWDMRLLIERSTAIKCPSIALQLSGAKKVQQALSETGVLERFIRDPVDRSLLQESWVKLYGFSGEDADSIEKLARTNPSRFVLKPQREGGGNNIYQEDIPGYLDQLVKEDKAKGSTKKAREAYILMEHIDPPPMKSVMVKAGTGQGVTQETISELGVYGVGLFGLKSTGEKIVAANETVGHLLRTKGRDSNEGGVAVGFSVIDSPLLL